MKEENKNIVKKKSYEIDMCNGPILSKMLLFTIPLMCSGILQLFFNAADIVVVGRYSGDNSLAAVGSNTALINLLTNLFVGLSIGVNVLVANYYGAKQQRDLRQTVHTAMLISIYSGIALTVVGIIGARQILIWMQAPNDILPLATTYLRIYFIGMTANMIYNFGSAILRAIGDTKRPLYYLLFSGVVNVILNLIFVIALRLDVAGVALATIISEYISAFLIIRCLVKEKGGIRLYLSHLKIDIQKLKKILQIGLPAGFQGIIFSFSNVCIQSSVNSFGAIVVAGNSAASNIEGFVYLAMNSFYQATISFTGQNVGAGKINRINKILFSGQFCVILVGLILGNGVLFFSDTLLGIYSSSPEVLAAGVKRLNIICTTYFLCGVMDVMVGSLRGMGYAVMPMFVSLAGVCGIRLIFIATLFRLEQFHFVEAIYWLYPISWIFTLSIHIICYIFIKKRLNKRMLSA